MSEKVTRREMDALIASTAKVLGLLAGVLAEAVGKRETAYHVAAAFDANAKMGGTALEQRLLREAMQLTLIKARNQHPDDEVIQDLCARLLPGSTKH